jgi:formylglycine-generating enzyme required for sulfatase activity
LAPDYYTRYPRPVLWLVPGAGEIKPFYLSTVPVTNKQYEAFDPWHPRAVTSPGDRDPVVGVSFRDALGYCAWYADVSRKPIRLPSEAEWEHACRAGSATRYPWGDEAAPGEAFVWSAETSGEVVPRLDEKTSNDFGLYGMLGGVWEWVAAEAPDTERAVLRGGSFRSPLEDLLSTTRRDVSAEERADDAGFRIAKSLR